MVKISFGSGGKKNRSGGSPFEFTLEWDKRLGWTGNPFEYDIFTPASRFLVSREKEKKTMNLFLIRDNKFGIIRGQSGTGKSMMLKWLQEELRSYGDRLITVYCKAKQMKNERDFVRKVIIPRLGLFERSFSKPHHQLSLDNIPDFLKERVLGRKSLVLLIDDCEDLTKDAILLLKFLIEEDVRLKIVGAEVSATKSKLSTIGLKDELNISLKQLPVDDILEVVRKRIESVDGDGISPFDEEGLKAMWKSSSTVEEFYKKCHEAALQLSLEQAELAKQAQEEQSKKRREAEIEKIRRQREEDRVKAKEKRAQEIKERKKQVEEEKKRRAEEKEEAKLAAKKSKALEKSTTKDDVPDAPRGTKKKFGFLNITITNDGDSSAASSNEDSHTTDSADESAEVEKKFEDENRDAPKKKKSKKKDDSDEKTEHDELIEQIMHG